MRSIRRDVFEQLVRSAFDPVVAGYGFELTPQRPPDHVEHGQAAAVYETSPAEFTRRFPGWAARWDFDDVDCVDLWVEADLTTGDVAVHLDGEGIRELAERSRRSDATAPTEKTSPLKEALESEAALCADVLAARAGR